MTDNHACPKCGADALLAYRAADYNKKMSNEQFRYYRCPKDGFIFLDPIPEDLGLYYPPSYYALPRDEAEVAKLASELQQWKLDTVLQATKSGRLLEIGAAYGVFSYLAKQAGFDVTAIEMDPRCCEFLRNTVGINVVETNDTLAALEALPTFDVIVMWQVIEHLPDPWKTLSAAAQRLAPGGVLVLDTPNPDAFQFAVLGHRWAHLDAPRHVCLLPAKLLKEHLATEGMQPEIMTASNSGANGFNGFGWAYTFQNFLGDNLAGRLGNYAGRALAKLLIPVERTGWRGSTYTAVFRKEA